MSTRRVTRSASKGFPREDHTFTKAVPKPAVTQTVDTPPLTQDNSAGSFTPNTPMAREINASASALEASRREAIAAEARRVALRAHQAARYRHLAGVAEPDLNDGDEVRHFEVDAQGSLTFILLADGEAWRLEEVSVSGDEREGAQMIAGKYYLVKRVGGR